MHRWPAAEVDNMSVIGEVRATLDAIGVEQQACVFVFLMSYPLALGGLLEARGRRIAGGTACASALAFAVFTNPWMHAVLLVVMGVGGIGVFIAGAYLTNHVSRRIALRGMPVIDAPPLPEELPAPVPSAERERVRLGRPVSVKP